MPFLTEEQARHKTCPHITYCVNETQVSHYQNAPIMVASTCLASECTAWRWAQLPFQKCDGNHAMVTPCADVQCWQGEDRTIPIGYCGLAGKPEC